MVSPGWDGVEPLYLFVFVLEVMVLTNPFTVRCQNTWLSVDDDVTEQANVICPPAFIE